MLTYVNLNMYCALSVVSDFVTPWTVAHQAPLFMEILQTRILVWVAMPSSLEYAHLSGIKYAYCITH